MSNVERENGLLEEKYKTLKAMRAMRGPEGAQARFLLLRWHASGR